MVQPTSDELIARARNLHPILFREAERTEREGRVSAEVMNQVIEAGLHRLGLPTQFGGHACGPAKMLRLGFELGRACPSTSWCVMIANGNAWSTSFWPEKAQQDVWGATPDSLVAGTALPTGTCAAVDGGYEVRGKWPFASNCDNSQWTFISAMLPEVDGQPQGMGWFLVPMDQLSIDHGSWEVAGLKGTGSKTLFADTPVFVPEHRAIRFGDVVQGTTPGSKMPGNRLANYSFATFSGVMIVAPLLGAAQGALDWFIDTMPKKKKSALRPGPPQTAADAPATQVRVGNASARIDAAMTMLIETLEDAEAKIDAGKRLSVAERLRVRRDIGFAAQQANEAVNILYEGAGASAAGLDIPVQRYWRDVNAGARHVGLDTEVIYGLVGQERFGLQPVGQF